MAKREKDINSMLLWGNAELMKLGFSHSMIYQDLFKREDMPTVKIGKRIFVHRELFLEWLKNQAKNESK